ncbi:hypothetical protein [Escherichia coli]|uniref:hypothetical protein n=1 Tax=Escherichia coli TaxID=562 RepID=UPI0017752E1C|nr:hypothetical protein [Escherichia coli]MCX9841744.1 hypothetical protein [Escherichia coli]MDC3533356.1 hypothetical protein [Escherichia coli]MDG5502698.1 hypothetical protein [Escherichia coli]HAJ6812202.1 hypothetical protein [Escherichia coli]HAN6622342.1 hypothetical protein [Escherichia coli]
MTLLEKLVAKLPSTGGWPKPIDSADLPLAGNELVTSWRWSKESNEFISVTYGDETVTKSQYEVAISGHKKPWNGQFPIPPGTEVEVHFDGDDSRVWTPFRVEYMCGEVVVLHDYRIDDVDAYRHKTLSFRPAITEEEKKRAALKEAVDGLIDGFMKSSGGDYSKLGAVVVDYLSLLKKLE